MKIIIRTKNFELTPAIQNFTEKKFSMLEKFVDSEIEVVLEKETNHHRKGDVFIAEAMVQLPGKNIVSVEKSDELLKAITACKDELKMEIEKHKVKTIDKVRREQRKSKRDVIK